MTTSACEHELYQLACMVAAERLPRDEDVAASPAEILARAIALAHMVGEPREVLDDPALATAAELFGFLRSGSASAGATAMDSFEGEPERAWLELRAGWFWSFAALVHNVWEHCTEPDEPGAWLEPEPGTWVLDFGAGAGVKAFALARAGAHVSCYEPNAVTRSFLSWRAEHSDPALAVRVLANAPWSDAIEAPYDVVLALDVLDHLEHPTAAIEHLATLERGGGRIVIRASFPDDGWHQGGSTIRQAVYRELRRHFEHDPQDGGEETFVMVRRDERSEPEGSPRLDSLLSLHPGTLIGPAPRGQPGYVLSAARFYVTPVWLDEVGVHMVDELRRPVSIADLQRAMRRWNVDDDEVVTALARLQESNLVLPRAPHS